MVILDVTVPVLGRFEVHDDLSITETLFHPSTGDEEVAVLVDTMRQVDSSYEPKKNVLLAALAVRYLVQEDDVTFHMVNEPPLYPEPDPRG